LVSSVPVNIVLDVFILYKQYALGDKFDIPFDLGQAEGMSIACCGSRDTSSPKGTMWKTVPHRLLFGRSSSPCWGTGGVAFLNFEINYNEKSYVCMYKITYVCYIDTLLIFQFRQGGILPFC